MQHPKKINVESKPEDPFDAPKKYLCVDGTFGCHGVFTKEKFRFSLDEMVRHERLTCLCRDCETKIGLEYGVDSHDASAVGTAVKNQEYYFSKIPRIDGITMREKVRALLLASGIPLKVELETETRRAGILRERFPVLCGVTSVKLNDLA